MLFSRYQLPFLLHVYNQVRKIDLFHDTTLPSTLAKRVSNPTSAMQLIYFRNWLMNTNNSLQETEWINRWSQGGLLVHYQFVHRVSQVTIKDERMTFFDECKRDFEAFPNFRQINHQNCASNFTLNLTGAKLQIEAMKCCFRSWISRHNCLTFYKFRKQMNSNGSRFRDEIIQIVKVTNKEFSVLLHATSFTRLMNAWASVIEFWLYSHLRLSRVWKT